MPKCIELLPCDWLISNLCYQAIEQVYLIKWPVSIYIYIYIYIYKAQYHRAPPHNKSQFNPLLTVPRESGRFCRQMSLYGVCLYRWGQVTHFQVSSKSQVPTIKSQASLKSQYKQIKQVKSSQWLTSSKSSRVLIRVKSSHSIKQEQIYFCHTTLLIFPQKFTFLIIHFK